MGRDKALLVLDGRALIEHMLDKLRGLGLTPRICGSRSDLGRFAEAVPDNFSQAGPLAGISSRRLLEGLRESLVAGRRKVVDGIRASALDLGESIDAFDVECIAATAPAEWPLQPALAAWFRNVNTPAEYDALNTTAGAKSRHPIS